MPPSGYSPTQSNAIRSLCESCLNALVQENIATRSPVEALERELAHINRDLETTNRPVVATKVLELTKGFYSALLARNPGSFESLAEHSEIVLDEIEESILDIHVVETA
ncbi:MAG: hypothetical protein UX89_C0012G0011 [Parcubacteria group bacterium GW2011_GWA2_47_16]|nr:MAG: hypothetical protein UX89_C0012G0011 [Parcubacteria group bacterium GW2011_GWA2_47_16]